MHPIQSFGELKSMLESIGWQLGKSKIVNGTHVLPGKGPGGQRAQGIGRSPEMALFQLVSQAERANEVRKFAALKLMGAWSTNWLADKDAIARAYAEMPVYDDKAAPAWMQLGNESLAQANTIRQKLDVEETDDPNPYHSIDQLITDVHHNRHYLVTRANVAHPVWSEDQQIAFRIVNDVVGHAQSRSGWDWAGVNAAAQVHMPIVSELAREALFVETVAQEAYKENYPGHDSKKVGFLSEHLNQETEGEHVQVPHGGDITQLAKVAMTPWNDYPAVDPDTPEDPNQHWESPYHGSPLVPSGSPSDYIDREAVVANANKLNDPTEPWWQRDENTQRRAIMNSFKVSILSPMKHLKWNAAHYQALLHADPYLNARELWDLIDDTREKHNQALGAFPGEHLKPLKKMATKLKALYKKHGESEAEAWRHAKDFVYKNVAEAEQRIADEYERNGQEINELRLLLNARKEVEDMVDNLMWPTGPGSQSDPQPSMPWQPSQKAPNEFADDLKGAVASGISKRSEFSPGLGYDPETIDQGGGKKFAGFIGNHIEAIANLAPYLETLRQYAQKDIHEDNGKGYIFRQGAKKLGVPGVDDKVASFAWLLLAPNTSDLAILDRHALRGLGYPKDVVRNSSDYYALERTQKALRDINGYGDLPQGQYHWGKWDLLRTPGHVSDHSAFRPLEPEPWYELEWPSSKKNKKEESDTGEKVWKPWYGPQEIENVRDHLEQVYQDSLSQLSGRSTAPVPLQRASRPLNLVSKVQSFDSNISNKVSLSLSEKKTKLNGYFNDMSPHSMNDAKKLGEEAAGLKLSKKELERFLKGHDEDAGNLPEWKRFKSRAIKAYESIPEWQRKGGWSEVSLSHEVSNEHDQSVVQLATTTQSQD